ncbi:helicase C-terminal domain-containing protein [Streptomyces somaliensis]|nr:helicase C-terminal domain-containing protein [Streptomyces somaliensis]
MTPDGPGKLDAAADKIAQIWQQYKDHRYTDREGNPSELTGALQLVFADRGTASEEAKKQGRFIAYDYLRGELVKRGIPEDKIRYAQDALTAEEKEKLFADARVGKVAVLIGSTDTMGVGVNVQDRAIALHHLDCPWRPSDVTQREGRIIRQFNQHFTQGVPVQIYRWTKAGSFDAFMWQTVERKARFIDQVRTGRELDEQDQAPDGDLGKDYLEYGEIKAIATGNPLLLKKLQADEEVRQLEAAYKSWQRTHKHLRNVVDTADETLAKAQEQADLVARALSVRTDTKGDAFRMELPNGTVVTKRGEAATALRNQIALIRRMTHGSVSRWENVATVGGQQFEARINSVHDYIEFRIRGLQDIPQATYTIDDVGGLVSDTKPPLGLVARLENLCERLGDIHTRLLGAVQELKQEIDRAQKLVDQPFTKLDKLHRARAERARLDAEIENQATGQDAYEDDHPGGARCRQRPDGGALRRAGRAAGRGAALRRPRRVLDRRARRVGGLPGVGAGVRYPPGRRHRRRGRPGGVRTIGARAVPGRPSQPVAGAGTGGRLAGAPGRGRSGSQGRRAVGPGAARSGGGQAHLGDGLRAARPRRPLPRDRGGPREHGLPAVVGHRRADHRRG